MAGPFEYLKVEISPDKTQARLDWRPSSVLTDEGESVPSTDALRNLLVTEHKISFIIESALEKVVTRVLDGDVVTGVIVADSQKPMIPGVDAWLEWLIEEEKPAVADSTGRVNFYSFSMLKNVFEGQPLAIFHPEEIGTDGVSVTAEPIPAPPPELLAIQAGENCEYREADRTFYALVGGRAELRGNQMLVSRLFKVDGNVDFSTGNIDFDGSVHVTGNVVDNFSIKATEGVRVDGIVEAAQIHSGGTVTVLGGINMRERGFIHAQGDIITRFINNSSVRCSGNVAAEKEILNTKVVAETVISPETEVAGGSITASKNIHVKEAGSPLGVRTVLQAGLNQDIADELAVLERTIQARDAEEAEMGEKLAAAKRVEHKLTPDKRAGLAKLIKANKAKSQATKELKEQAKELRKTIYRKDAQVIILKEVHAGVIIKIGKYERALMEDHSGFRRYVFNEDKYEVEAHFD